jgi:hypothetical protein
MGSARFKKSIGMVRDCTGWCRMDSERCGVEETSMISSMQDGFRKVRFRVSGCRMDSERCGVEETCMMVCMHV